jgi:hypothetical protein
MNPLVTRKHHLVAGDESSEMWLNSSGRNKYRLHVMPSLMMVYDDYFIIIIYIYIHLIDNQQRTKSWTTCCSIHRSKPGFMELSLSIDPTKIGPASRALYPGTGFLEREKNHLTPLGKVVANKPGY